MSATSVAASQAEPRSNASTISPTRPFGRLCAVKMIYLGSLSASNPHPSRGTFTYLIRDFYFHKSYLEKQQSIFTQTNNIQIKSATASAGLSAPTGDIRTHRYLHTHAHLCCLRCFDRPGCVWGPLETSWSWERCLPIRWQLQCHHGSYL